MWGGDGAPVGGCDPRVGGELATMVSVYQSKRFMLLLQHNLLHVRIRNRLL